MPDLPIDRQMEEIVASARKFQERYEERARRLARDGRAGRLHKAKPGANRQAVNEDQIRWAFWQLAHKDDGCQAGRQASQEAYLYETIDACMGMARQDERDRIARAAVTGLRALLGEEANALLYHMAEAAGLLDD